MKSQITRDEILSLIIKKAYGFVYCEEQYEFEKTQNNAKNTKNLSENNILYENLSFFKNNDTSETSEAVAHDTIKLENKNANETGLIFGDGLTLVKKKVTTHYVQPDMVAIKILFDEVQKKDGDETHDMSDDELIKLKNKLIEELTK